MLVGREYTTHGETICIALILSTVELTLLYANLLH
jgi:hypothetical protein